MQQTADAKPHVIPVHLLIIGSLLSLVLSMGLARFAYTLILPLMQRQVAFDNQMAGWLASANLAGYFLGSILVTRLGSEVNRIAIMRWGIVACVVSIGGKGLTISLFLWGILQFIGGFAGAAVLIICTAVAFDQLAIQKKSQYTGFVYCGVGLGIALSAAVVILIGSTVTASSAWVSLGVLATIAAIPVWLWVKESDHSPQIIGPLNTRSAEVPTFLWWVNASYFIAAIGYIITATYLVKIVERATGSLAVGSITWLITGVAGTLTTMLWPYLARRWGYVWAIVSAQLIQVIGILLPIFSDEPLVAYLSASLFGGTFIGSFLLHLAFGRTVGSEQNGTKIIGILTASFAVGQAIGPIIGGTLAEIYGTFDPALVLAAGCALLAPLVLTIGLRLNHSNQAVTDSVKMKR
ncbi:MAG: YbfB/YjiJ family MFS transporter [Chloroflexota bacterium]